MIDKLLAHRLMEPQNTLNLRHAQEETQRKRYSIPDQHGLG